MEVDRPDFIAERPHIFDNDITMPWPSEEDFMELVPEEAINADPNTDHGRYALPNAIYHLRDDYFRMRYRGAQWGYEQFTGEELPDDEQGKLDAFLSHGYWAPAINIALDLFEETGDPKYKTTAVFATGLHIWDALNHSWAFLDSSLANDSGVREKHLLGFALRIHQVEQLPMDETEKEYFESLQIQFNLAYAEMSAQSPASALRDLMIFDNGTNTQNMQPDNDDRSELISFTDAPEDIQLKVIERFKLGALDNSDHPVFYLEMLHLFGLTNIGAYDQIPGYDTRWWKLSAEEILESNTSRLGQPRTDKDSGNIQFDQATTFEQGTLF